MNAMAVLAFPAGILIATVVSAVGIGGGILWMPFFILFLKIPPDTAVVTSLLVQTAGMGSGSVAFIRKKTVDLALAGLFLALTIPGLAVGALLTRLLSSANLGMALGLLTLTTAFLFVCVNQKFADTGLERVQLKKALRYGWLVSILAITSGMLSVSIGEWLVPLMCSRLKLRMRTAVATSIIMIFGTCVAGSFFHLVLGGTPDMWAFACAVPGVIIGGQLGPRLMENINERLLKDIFVFLLTLVSIHLIYSSY